jgi:hypothetical protein
VSLLCDTYHWPPDFWRSMGWREFKAWLRERRQLVERQNQAHTSDPNTWAGAERDGWWAQQRAKREQIRGRG